MGQLRTRTLAGILLPAAAIAAVLAVVLSGGAAGAHPTRHIRTESLLTMKRGSFEVSLGTAPEWLPLADTAQTLTLIAGAPSSSKTSADNAYVGFTAANRSCAATPAASRRPYYTLASLYSSRHSAATHAGVFAPNRGAARGTYIDSVPGVVIHQSERVKACVWLAATPGTTSQSPERHPSRTRAPRSLAATLVLPLLNRTFAASVSNLTGAGAGHGGFTMFAIDGGHPFRYGAITSQCSVVARDGVSTVAAGTPGSEQISISASPCSTDGTSFNFSGAGFSRGISYPLSDALASPAVTVGVGGCELDPLTGVTLTAAEEYLAAVGCMLGTIQISPYQKTQARGSVSWAAVDGGVAELAPVRSTVDLVLNGTP